MKDRKPFPKVKGECLIRVGGGKGIPGKPYKVIGGCKWFGKSPFCLTPLDPSAPPNSA
jgi:hypothetical protein